MQVNSNNNINFQGYSNVLTKSGTVWRRESGNELRLTLAAIKLNNNNTHDLDMLHKVQKTLLNLKESTNILVLSFFKCMDECVLFIGDKIFSPEIHNIEAYDWLMDLCDRISKDKEISYNPTDSREASVHGSVYTSNIFNNTFRTKPQEDFNLEEDSRNRTSDITTIKNGIRELLEQRYYE